MQHEIGENEAKKYIEYLIRCLAKQLDQGIPPDRIVQITGQPDFKTLFKTNN